MLAYVEQDNLYRSSLLPGPNFANLAGENPGGPYYSGEANLGHQLWSLICFERWLQMLPDWTKRAHVA